MVYMFVYVFINNTITISLLTHSLSIIHIDTITRLTFNLSCHNYDRQSRAPVKGSINFLHLNRFRSPNGRTLSAVLVLRQLKFTFLISPAIQFHVFFFSCVSSIIIRSFITSHIHLYYLHLCRDSTLHLIS